MINGKDPTVYFLHMSSKLTGQEYFKIGYSSMGINGAIARWKAYDSHFPVEIKMFGYAKGSIQDEHKIHALFNKYRVRKNREWFYATPVVKDFIENIVKDGIVLWENFLRSQIIA